MKACINCTNRKEHPDQIQRDHNPFSSKCAVTAKACVTSRQDETLCGLGAKFYKENQEVKG